MTSGGAVFRYPRRLPEPPSWVFDLAPVGLAALDTWLNAKHVTPYELGAAAVATVALLLRRHFPLTVLAIALPSLVVSESVLPALIALYTVSGHYRNRWLLAGLTAVVALGYATPWPSLLVISHNDTLLGLIYATMTAAAPVFLGLLTRERTQLAREMHDVVSHQVSLIAVSAGALQVGAPDSGTKEAASTIRALSVNTLDELRHMVTLLRASGSQPTELTPQPTLAELERLIATSGIPVRLHGDLSADAGAAQQRAIYRTIQEALTNVRKHAPGAPVTVHIEHTTAEVGVTVVNGPPTRPTLNLPSARHGLVGLRERAELLDGSFGSGPAPGGGYRVHLRLPRAES